MFFKNAARQAGRAKGEFMAAQIGDERRRNMLDDERRDKALEMKERVNMLDNLRKAKADSDRAAADRRKEESDLIDENAISKILVDPAITVDGFDGNENILDMNGIARMETEKKLNEAKEAYKKANEGNEMDEETSGKLRADYEKQAKEDVSARNKMLINHYKRERTIGRKNHDDASRSTKAEAFRLLNKKPKKKAGK